MPEYNDQVFNNKSTFTQDVEFYAGCVYLWHTPL